MEETLDDSSATVSFARVAHIPFLGVLQALARLANLAPRTGTLAGQLAVVLDFHQVPDMDSALSFLLLY